MTDKERFEELAYNVGISLDGEKALMSSDDYDFLYNYALKQAERVQELEELVEGYKIELMIKDNAKKRANQQNKRYREALEEIARGRFPGASYKARQALEGEE